MSSKRRAERQREGLTIERGTNHREGDPREMEGKTKEVTVAKFSGIIRKTSTCGKETHEMEGGQGREGGENWCGR